MQKLLTSVWIGFVAFVVLAFSYLLGNWWVAIPIIIFGIFASYLTTDYMGRHGYNLQEYYQLAHYY
jgi:uncharacterized membrane protein